MGLRVRYLFVHQNKKAIVGLKNKKYQQDIIPVPKEMSKEEYLNIKLERAIEMEDFEEAVKLRDQIKNLGTNKEMIENLELELKESIKEKNFEKSIEIRDQLRKLKS